MGLRQIYHRLVPDRIRYPVGHARRSVLDTWTRLRTPGPALPPRSMLKRVQMTPWCKEFLHVGQASAKAIVENLDRAGIPVEVEADVLDFGCGLGRTLRHLLDTSWRLHGCDVDRDQVAWCAASLPGVDALINEDDPPLPFSDSSFDAVWAISVFTHFAAQEQERWATELARVLRPGGLALITTMGPHALGGFANLDGPDARATLSDDGFYFHRGGETFNARGAFHTRDGLAKIFGGRFETLSWREGGLDGFQDLSMLRLTDGSRLRD